MNRKRLLPLIYVAGPYTADSKKAIELNVQKASQYGLYLLHRGWAPVVPHSLTYMLNQLDFDKSISYERWMDIVLSIAMRCDAGFFIPGWRRSKGARMERDAMGAAKLPCWERLADVPKGEDFWDWQREQETYQIEKQPLGRSAEDS